MITGLYIAVYKHDGCTFLSTIAWPSYSYNHVLYHTHPSIGVRWYPQLPYHKCMFKLFSNHAFQNHWCISFWRVWYSLISLPVFLNSSALDEMGNRIDDLERNIADLMTQAGPEEVDKWGVYKCITGLWLFGRELPVLSSQDRTEG